MGSLVSTALLVAGARLMLTPSGPSGGGSGMGSSNGGLRQGGASGGSGFYSQGRAQTPGNLQLEWGAGGGAAVR